jgi:hypothetical protein
MGLFKGSFDWRPARVLEGLGVGKDAAGVLSGDTAAEPVVEELDKIVDPLIVKEQEAIDKAAAETTRRTAEQRTTMEGYWGNYQTWVADAKSGFDRSMGSMKARMAAGGIKSGTEQWDTNLAKVQSDYEGELAGFKKGVTGSALEQWSAQAQGGADAPMGMEDFMSQEFGMRSFDSDRAATDETRAEGTARQAASGTQDRSKKTSTASPWW